MKRSRKYHVAWHARDEGKNVGKVLLQHRDKAWNTEPGLYVTLETTDLERTASGLVSEAFWIGANPTGAPRPQRFLAKALPRKMPAKFAKLEAALEPHAERIAARFETDPHGAAGELRGILVQALPSL